MRDERYLTQPYEISIETLALCNAACNFCPYPALDRKGVELPNEILADLIQQMMGWEHPFFLSPFKVNEPFLDKRLLGLLEHINLVLPKATLRLFTNGTTLADNNLKRIAHLKNVAHLWVSLNSVTEHEHEKLMGFKQFDTVIHHLDRLHDLTKRQQFKHPVILSRVYQGNIHDIEFMEQCKRKWPRFRVQMIKKDSWLGYTEPQFDTVPAQPCARWWELSICANGDASLCCMDGTGEFKLGNVVDKSLLMLYNDPIMIMRRAGLLKRRASENNPCNRCTY